MIIIDPTPLTGPISLPEKLPNPENVFRGKTSIFFRNTKVIRMFDKQHNALIFLAVSKKLTEGSLENSISTVPIIPWSDK
jgi:CreA protein